MERDGVVQLRRTLGQLYLKPKFKREIDTYKNGREFVREYARCIYCGGYNTVKKGKVYVNHAVAQRYVCYDCDDKTFTYPNEEFFTK